MEPITIKSRIRSLLRKSRARAPDSGQVTLEKVLGITTAGPSGITCDPCSGTVAYPAGCVVVLLNPAKNTQQHLISSSSQLFSRKPDARYPDSVAVTFDPVNRWLSCVYNDHSLYVWDTRDLQKVGKVHSALYHSACVWDLQMFPADAGGPQLAPGRSELFLSCSADSTVRIWNTDLLSDDLHHVIYTDDNPAALLDVEGTAVGGPERPEGPSADGRSGIRTICVSPDGRHLASGDQSGTLRIHDLSCLKELVRAEAHDAEILCLEYSKPHTGVNLLATASRDRLIHVLDVQEDYGLLQTLDEHSSSVTSVRFAASEGKLRLISCGTDKSVYIRTAHRTARGTAFKRTHHVVRKMTPNDMDVDPTCKYAVVGCQDRSVRVINISSGKQKRSYKGSQAEDGSLLKVQMDPSGLYLATSCSDKNISLFDFRTGECLATVFGHSEIVTALRFSSDCRRLVSSSGDSCVFVWRLAPELTVRMRERLSERRRRPSGLNARNNPFRRSSGGFTLRRSPSIMSTSSKSDREEEDDDDDDDDEDDDEDDVNTERRPDSSQCEDSSAQTTGAPDDGHERKPVKDSSVCRRRRRWSCHVGSVELMVKSMLDLRLLDPLPEAAVKNRISARGRGSSSSLQEWNRCGARPVSAWLLPVCAPEPDGVVLYPDRCPSSSSLTGPSYRAQIPGQAEEAQSPISGASMGYSSGGSSPDYRRHDDPDCSDVERGEASITNTRRDSETPAEGISVRSQTPDSSSRTGPVCLHKPAVRPLMEHTDPDLDCVSRRSCPYTSRTPALLHRSASAAEARKSLTPSCLRRGVRPTLPKLNLERMDRRLPRTVPSSPSSPQPWARPTVGRVLRSHSYMSPTTSSRAKASLLRPSGSCESLPFPSAPAEQPHAPQRFRPVTSDLDPQQTPHSRASSVTSADQEPAVSLEACRRAAADLCRSVRRATGLYRTLMSHDAERSSKQQQMMSDALLLVRSELDSVQGSPAWLVSPEREWRLRVLSLEV